MSKSFGMAGLRIGWVATRDRELLSRLAAFKDYTTICASAPSELLALVALEGSRPVMARNTAIVAANMPLLDGFFARWAGTFEWVRPLGGSIGFARLLADVPVDRFTEDLVRDTGVLICPARFRRHGQPFPARLRPDEHAQALERLESYAARTLR